MEDLKCADKSNNVFVMPRVDVLDVPFQIVYSYVTEVCYTRIFNFLSTVSSSSCILEKNIRATLQTIH